MVVCKVVNGLLAYTFTYILLNQRRHPGQSCYYDVYAVVMEIVSVVVYAKLHKHRTDELDTYKKYLHQGASWEKGWGDGQECFEHHDP